MTFARNRAFEFDCHSEPFGFAQGKLREGSRLHLLKSHTKLKAVRQVLYANDA